MKPVYPTGIRRAVQAGRFYPASAVRLQADINDYLGALPSPESRPPKAIIVPHAGYTYSAAVAAAAFVRLAPAHDRLRRVILLGPAHYVEFDGLALSGHEAFATPLGTVPLDPEGCATARDLPHVAVYEEAHQPEHSLEVELPFLQTVLDAFTLVPLLVGHAPTRAVADVLNRLWGGEETCVVVSSDLSHYLDDASARRQDQATAAAIEALQGEKLDCHCACGHRPIAGLLHVAPQHGLRGETLALSNSSDAGASRDRVVGYGAFAFTQGVSPHF